MKFQRTIVSMEMLGNAIYGMRNPMNSWEQSDSVLSTSPNSFLPAVKLGEKDLKLAHTLIKSGPDHAKFLRQIPVSVQITAPAYWWPEMDQYKVATVTNSTSKMHKLLSTPITQECFEDIIDPTFIRILEHWRQNAINDKENSKVWWKTLLAHLPHSWLQTRMWTANYAVLRNIYFQRKAHKLNQWSDDFINWIATLPYAKELIMWEPEPIIN